TALQLRNSFMITNIYSVIISIFSVISGIFISYYFNLSTGGTIVLLMLGIFCVVILSKKYFKI
ncbi:MAG: metal ABC transporter permease, partial [Candidatus Nomurabacteria bacterium]|nr:metal ABC transporter permease [Candidatus Nomurabacteria bacterium]